MLRLGRPVGAYPRLEARLAAIHLGSRDEEAEAEKEEHTGCAECGGEKPMPCSEKGDDEAEEGDCGCDDSDNDTKYASSDCGCNE
jgi:hypothetical protein